MTKKKPDAAPNAALELLTQHGGLIDYATDESCFGDSNPVLIEDCRKIAQRLLSDQPVAELADLAKTSGDEAAA